MNDQLLDDLVGNADPIGRLEPELSDALAAMGTAIPLHSDSTTRTPRSRKRRRVVVAITVVAALGVGTAAAAAGGLFARTGEQGDGGEFGSGEILRMDADDLSAVLIEIGADVPLPPGVELSELTRFYAEKEPALSAEDGIRASIEFDAACKWTEYWLTSESAGDQPAMDGAEAGLQSVLAMPDITASDGGRTMDNWRTVASAIGSDDPNAVAGLFYRSNCTE